MNGNIFTRTNLRQISSFILYDDATPDTNDNLSYTERLKKGCAPIYEKLEQICKDRYEFENVVADLYSALSVYEEVFTEIGMKSGARIILQLLQHDSGEAYTNTNSV